MTKTLGQAIVLMNRRSANIAKLSQKFFAKNKAKYHGIGFARLYSDVYLKFPEGDYQRTMSLLSAFDTALIKDGMKLFLNESSVTAANRPGDYKYYPSYVSIGVVRGPTAGKERNIPTGWKEALKDKVTNDFRQQVNREVVRAK